MQTAVPGNSFVFEGKTYHFRRELKDDKWIFAVFCGDEQVLHTEISTTVSDSKETIAAFDREHGRGAYEAFTFEKLMNIVTHVVPLLNEHWKEMQKRDSIK